MTMFQWRVVIALCKVIAATWANIPISVDDKNIIFEAIYRDEKWI